MTGDGARRRGSRDRALVVGCGAAAVLLAAVVGGIVGGSVARPAGTTATSSGTTAVCDARAVAEAGLPSVVTISAGRPDGRPGGTGSGEIIRAGGYILTNDHVISVAAGGGALQVLYADGRSAAAAIVGRDPLTDLAVLRAADGAAGWPPITAGSSRALAVGQPVVALGAPLGLYGTVTSGIVSALDRDVQLPADSGQSAHLVGALQTDAAINPGNSGGPLVDCAGRLVGVNTAIATVPNAAGQSGGGSVGLGFAAAADVALPIADELITTGAVVHGTVGLRVQAIPPALARRAGIPQGLYVESVTAGGPAAAAGIGTGDVVTDVNGQPATSAEQVTVAELGVRSGRPVELTVRTAAGSRTVPLVPVRQT